MKDIYPVTPKCNLASFLI